MARDTSHSVKFFKDFVQADTFPTLIESFKQLCDSLDIDTKDFEAVYAKLKDGIRTVEAVNLWKLLDKRAELNVYNAGNICKGKKVKGSINVSNNSVATFYASLQTIQIASTWVNFVVGFVLVIFFDLLVPRRNFLKG